MKPALKPLKRSEQLAPLSREHHDGLLFVWKLRQGLKNDTPIETLRNYCNWYWKNNIRAHFYQEEKILLPYLPSEDKLALRLLKEHNDIRDLLLAVDDDPDKLIIDLLASFVEGHIRFEERVLFPHLENLLTVQQLDSISTEIADKDICHSDWKDEFWTRKNIDNTRD
jgi:hemerythrin-like domain-containing protein